MISTAKRFAARLARTYPGRLLQAYGASNAGHYAAGLAFTAFISMFPLILGMLALLGVATSSPSARQSFLNAALTIFPVDARSTLVNTLDTIRQHSGLLGIVSFIGLLWSGSSLFVAMEYALGRMMGARQRDFPRQRAMTVLMTVVFVLAVVATVGVNAALSVVSGIAPIEPIAGLLIWIGFMTALYRLVPNRTFRIRQLWPGVFLAATLMEVLTLLWPLYARISHGFSTYGQTFALFFVLATWLYFLAQFILLGAVANRLHSGVPRARGVIASSEPVPFETDATRAVDRVASAHRRAA